MAQLPKVHALPPFVMNQQERKMSLFTRRLRKIKPPPTKASPVKLDESSFVETVTTHPLVIVDFWAPWCGPCRAFGPIFARSAAAHPEILFTKINVDENPNLARQFKIRSIPMIVTFTEGQPASVHVGALPSTALEKLINELPENKKSP